MELIKKTSLFSDSNFPLYVRDDQNFDMLRRFVKSYFESLEVPGAANYELTNARENSDIDTTTEEFLDRFYQILCPDLPTKIKADKRLLLKHARELYQKKGTPDSFHLLFKILFNETITLKYPGDYVLRGSDGIWNQPVAIRAVFGNTPEADVLNTVNKEVIAINANGIIRNNVVSVKRLKKSSVYEILIENQKNKRFFVGDTIKIGGTIEGVIVPSVESVRIMKTGKNFKKGQPLFLNLGDATGTIVKVTSVDDAGRILAVKIIRYGTEYNTNSTITIKPTDTVEYGKSSTTIGANISASDKTSGFSEIGSITRSGHYGEMSDYFFEQYMEPTEYYTASEVATFGGITGDGGDSTNEQNDDSYAIFAINVGPVIVYPGFWSNNQGNLSDPQICLQDNQFYQNYSYVIQSSVPRQDYVNHVKTIIHPAGMRMFSDLMINNVLDIGTELATQDGANIRIYVNDIVDIPDQHVFDMEMAKFDDVTPEELVEKEIEKIEEEQVDVVENIDKDITIQYAETLTAIDVFAREQELKITDTLFVSDNDIDDVYAMAGYVVDVYAEAGANQMTKEIDLVYSENQPITDTINKEFSIDQSDVTTAVESITTSTNINVSETISIVEDSNGIPKTIEHVLGDIISVDDVSFYSADGYVDAGYINTEANAVTIT